jgi:Ca2+-binding RTX toxin-like protein
MSTLGLNVINLQVRAEEQLKADEARGVAAALQAADNKHYLWHSTFQTRPIGIDTNPEQVARDLRAANPFVETLRIPINAYSFNADGSLDPLFERFLTAAAQQDFRILFVHMDGDAQRYGTGQGVGNPDASGGQIFAHLRDTLGPRMNKTMDKLLDWMAANPSVNVWGIETHNEPNAFDYGMKKLGTPAAQAQFVKLYVDQVTAAAETIAARFDGKILVGGWNYSARFDILNATVLPGGKTALQTIRDEVGSQLVWSSHLYAGWLGTDGIVDQASADLILERIYRHVLSDDILVTETNVPGSQAYDPLIANQTYTNFALHAYSWFADKGIGLTWFPGAFVGGSALVSFDSDGAVFRQQGSYAAHMDTITLGVRDPQFRGSEASVAVLVPGKVENQPTAPDADRYDPVDGLGLGVGYEGNDTLLGLANANNMLYGGFGNDVLMGHQGDDFLFGQDGNDTLLGAGGNDHLFGGRGNDLLIAMDGFNTLWGGAGGDRFSVHVAGQTIIADLKIGDGDTLDFRGHYKTAKEVLKRTSVIDHKGDGGADLLVWHGGGGYTIILGAGDRPERFVRTLIEFPASGDRSLPAKTVSGPVYSAGTPTDPHQFRPLPSPAMPEGLPPASLSGPMTLNGTLGSDLVAGGPGHDRLFGSAGNDTLLGGAGDDTLLGDRGNNLLFGGDGNDALYSGRHASSLIAGAGDDNVFLRMDRAGHKIWLGAGADTIHLDWVEGDGTSFVYDFSFAEDRIRFEDRTLNLKKLPPGLSMQWTENGGILSIGSDTPGTARIVLIDPSRGPNRQLAPGVLDAGTSIGFNPANPTLRFDQAGPGPQGPTYSRDIALGPQTPPLIGAEGLTQLQAGNGGEQLVASGPGVFKLLGGSGNDTLKGAGANDVLRGERGNDLLFGGGGNDTIQTGAGRDTVRGGAGNDLIDGRDGGRNVLSGGGGNDTLLASDAGDRISGGAGNDLIRGGAGADTLGGGPGRDTLFGSKGNDLMSGGAGADRMSGGAGRDLLRGRAGDDTLSGGTGADTLIGGKGHDRLNGGPGRDILTGGEGADTFVFAKGYGVDRITDFSRKQQDRLELSDDLWRGDLDAAGVVSRFATKIGGKAALKFSDTDVLIFDGIADLGAMAEYIDIF